MSVQAKHQPITLKRNRTYCAYQFHSFIFKDSDVFKGTEDVFVRCVLHVMDWLSMKFKDVGLPDGLIECDPSDSLRIAPSDFISFEARETAGYQLEVITSTTKEFWAMRLREPDLGAEDRSGGPGSMLAPQPGRMYETNIGVAISGNNVEFAVNVIISEPEFATSEGTGFRPAVVGYLVRDERLSLSDSFNDISGHAINCCNDQDVQSLLDWLGFEGRQEPALVICADATNGESFWPVDPGALAHELFGFAQVFTLESALLPLLNTKTEGALPGDLLLFCPDSEDRYRYKVRLQGEPSELIATMISSQAKSYLTGKSYDFGKVLLVADFLFERYNELNDVRLGKWAELDQANQTIAELEDALEFEQSSSSVTQVEIDKLKTELAEAQNRVASREASLAIAIEAANQAERHARQDSMWQPEEYSRIAKAKLLFIGGDGHLKDKDLQGILKSFGFDHPAKSYEWIKYEDAKKFNFQELIASTQYSDVIMGSTPHSCSGIGKYESPAHFLRKEKDLPQVAIVMAGKELGNFTKSNIRPYIKDSKALALVRSRAC